MQLTQKETDLLKDLKAQEQLCIEKYTKHAETACDGNLKNLFNEIGQTEKQHFDTLNQISAGTVPQMNGGAKPIQAPTSVYNTSETPEKKTDCYLCSDVLAGEKHVSSVYDTCIFEFKDPAVRNALNHIQKEEQEHGEKIYDYMAKNAMYS